MKKRRLGRTNLEVSVIGFGGEWVIPSSVEYACKMYERALELGINYFDAARIYGNVEEKLGIALEDVRDEVVIATKTHHLFDPDAARVGLKQSLRNLRTDRVDIVIAQHIDNEKALEKFLGENSALPVLKEARSQGKIDFIGLSGHKPYVLAKAIETGEFDMILVPFNIITREAAEELLPLAKKLDVGVAAMKVFGGPNQRFVQFELAKIVPEKVEFDRILGEGYNRTTRCLGYVLEHDVHTCVCGWSTIEEVESAAKAAANFTGLTPREKEDLRFGELPPEPFCRDCGLCLRCPEGLKIPLILSLDKYFTYYKIINWTREIYERLAVKVTDCTKCGVCETKCPYKLPIIAMLEQAHKRLSK
ncbi:MAG: aldo/keto reductase [Candidatus Bathyarchaeia archaeon]